MTRAKESMKFVPQFLSSSKARSGNADPYTWCVTDFAHSDVMLFDILNGLRIEGEVNVNADGAAIKVHAIWFDKLGLTALYINDDVNLNWQGKQILLRVSRLQYGPELFPYGLVKEVDILRHVFYVSSKSLRMYTTNKYNTHCPRLRSWLEGDSELPNTKVSSLHLRHITAHELRQLGPEYILSKIPHMLSFLEHMIGVGMHESMCIGLICWALFLEGPSDAYCRASGIWFWRPDSVENFITMFKEKFSLRMKAIQNLTAMDMTCFFELEVLANRGLGAIDWEKEKNHRTDPNTANITKETVLFQAMKLFRQTKAKGGKPIKTSWSEYWDNRWQWAPTGSVHSQYPEDRQYYSKDIFNRHKLFSVCAMPNKKLHDFSNRKPQIRAWPSTKYEWTKMRAIYGVDLTNFIITGFAMGDCEEVLAKTFPIGSGANELRVRAKLSEMLKNGTPFCFDYEDFNSQHSTAAMKAVLEAYAYIYKDDMDPEQAVAMKWVIDSVNDCAVMDGSEQSYITNGTLMSGWRLTSFINTVLNYVYLQVVMDGEEIISEHNGDDIIAAVDNIATVKKIMRNARKLNIRFQQQKCFLGSIAEFLRIDHKAGSGGQYLSRATATLVHGPTETSVPNNLMAVLTAIDTRTKEVLERGANKTVVYNLRSAQIRYQAKKWGVQQEDIEAVFGTHVTLGGLTDEITQESLSHKITQKVIKVADPKETAVLDMKTTMHGADAYARRLTRHIIPDTYFKTVRDKATKAVFCHAQNRRFGIVVENYTPDGTDRVKASRRGLYRGEVKIGKLALAAAFGIPILDITVAENKAHQLIRHEHNKLEALKLLF